MKVADPELAPAGITTLNPATGVKSAASACPLPPPPVTVTGTVVAVVSTGELSGKEAVTRAVVAGAPSVTDDWRSESKSSASTRRLIIDGG